MAIAIKSIPTLKKKTASKFIKTASENVTKRESVNFSKQVKSADSILKKANF